MGSSRVAGDETDAVHDQMITIAMTLVSFVFCGMCATARVENVSQDGYAVSLFDSLSAARRCARLP